MTYPVVYFEILEPDDLETHLRFYRDVFGWEPNEVPAEGEFPYRMFNTNASRGVNGGIGKHPQGENYVTFYAQVDELQPVLDKAESSGGRTKMPVTEVIPGELSVALVESPSGNVVGIMSGTGSAPARGDAGGKHPVVHFEIAAPDAAAEQEFWRDLLGWSMNVDPQFNYGMVDAGEGGIAGGIGPHPDGGKHVTFYVECEDPQQTLERAEQLGAKTVTPVMEVPGGPTVAQIQDLGGNMIGLVKSR